MIVFVVQHAHETEECEEDIKFIGVFSSLDKAQAAIEYLSLQSGFKDTVECFHIDKYTVDAFNWMEGYSTQKGG